MTSLSSHGTHHVHLTQPYLSLHTPSLQHILQEIELIQLHSFLPH